MANARVAVFSGWFLGGAVMLAAPGTAAAEGGPVELDYEGDYVKLGVNLAASFHDDERPRGVVLGVEAGLTRLAENLSWYGGTAEVCRDFAGDDATRFYLGPKVGWAPVGLDLRYVGELNDRSLEHGVNVRLRLTLALVGAYVGVSRVGDNYVTELGLQGKLPLWVSGE